jgi:hypothetical protein
VLIFVDDGMVLERQPDAHFDRVVYAVVPAEVVVMRVNQTPLSALVALVLTMVGLLAIDVE